MIGFMTAGDLGLVFAFVEKKPPNEGDVAVTDEFWGEILGRRDRLTMIHRDHARFFCNRAQIVRFQRFLKVEEGRLKRRAEC